MTDGTFVKEIERLAKPRIEKVGEVPYSAEKLSIVSPPTPKPLLVHTLQSVADYIEFNVDQLRLTDCMLHVAGPADVYLLGMILEPTKSRDTLLHAEFSPPSGFQFERFYPPDEFNIYMQTHFQDGNDRADVLKVIGNIVESTVRSSADDGIAQEISVRAGISRSKEQQVPNPVRLAPFRTFPEVAQPSSLFVLRMRTGSETAPPTAALFEADGGAWRLAAIKNVQAWLKERVGDVSILA